MRKYLTAALAVAMGITFGSALVGSVEAAPQGDVIAKVTVTKEYRSTVDWEKGPESDVVAEGYGVAPEGMIGPRAKVMARRAALIDAQRSLLEAVNGLQIDADTVVENLAVKSDVVRTQIHGYIKGAQIIKETQNPDGSYCVKMRLPLYGRYGVAAAVVPQIAPKTPAPLPSVSASVPERTMHQVRTAHYTGIVVDARGLGLEATFSPVIYDTTGRVVYGVNNIDPDFAISQGMVAYARSMREIDAGSSRAGSNPLVLNAVQVRGGVNSVNPVNVVVSVEDADKILLACENSNITNRCAVVFVK